MLVPGSLPDPYVFKDVAQFGYNNTDGRTQVSPYIVAGQSTAVFVVAGQSLAANTVDTNYTPVSPNVHVLNIYDGGVYSGIDPMLGIPQGNPGQTGSFLGRLGDKLIASGKWQRVVFVPVAVGNTSASQWAIGGIHNKRLLIGPRRAAALNFPITAFLWQQGENDTVLGTTQATYTTELEQIIATPRAEGFNAPWFIARSTYTPSGVSSAVQAAYAAVIASVTNVYAGADTDSLTSSTYRQASDGQHLTAAGADANAALWATALSTNL